MRDPGNGLAQIIGRFSEQYIEQYHPNSFIIRTLDALQKCRTQALGGHIERCDNCKPTIFTANHKLETNENLVGGAVYSRMVGFLTTIQPNADDKRIANRIEDDSAKKEN